MNNTPQTGDAYWRDVIDPGDRASKLAKEVCFQSHGNSEWVRVVPLQPDNFRGAIGFLWKPYVLQAMAEHTVSSGEVVDWKVMEAVENDGAGGKSQFLTFLGEEDAFRSHGWEIITMTADDFARTGRLPVVIDNEINAKRINDKNFHLFEAMMRGYGEALKAARLVNITGEIAVMRHSITAFCDVSDEQLVLTWGASCIGLCARNKLIDGTRIVPGMSVIGLHEKGYRCNGGTFFTNVLLAKWGNDMSKAMQDDVARNFVRKLTVPSVSYADFIAGLNGWYGVEWDNGRPDIRGIAHITGGGVWGKFKEILPAGVGANLHSMPTPPEVLLEAQDLSQGTEFNLSDWQGYGTLHGGCGMLLVCEAASVVKILQYAKFRGIEASPVGVTTASDINEVLITSRFLRKTGQTLSSERRE